MYLHIVSLNLRKVLESKKFLSAKEPKFPVYQGNCIFLVIYTSTLCVLIPYKVSGIFLELYKRVALTKKNKKRQTGELTDSHTNGQKHYIPTTRRMR